MPKAPPWPKVPGESMPLTPCGSRTMHQPSPQPLPGMKPALEVAGLNGGHLADAVGRDDAVAVEFAAVQHGLVEAIEVGGGGEEAAGRIRHGVGFAGVEPRSEGLSVASSVVQS